MLNSILFTVGIDEYYDRRINRLSYCVSDCLRVERTFTIFNIAKECFSLNNQYAKKDAILKLLRSFQKNLDEIYVYYSAHGEERKKSTYLYTYDTNNDDISASSLSLSVLMDVLSSLKPSKITIILDACNINKPSLKANNIQLYCPDSKVTEEDTALTQGIFTAKTLKLLILKYKNNLVSDKQKRYQRIRQEIASLMKNDTLALILGKSGTGKSYFLRQIKQEERYVLYVSIPKIQNLSLDIILTLINEEIAQSNKDKYEKFIDVDPEKFIRFYINSNPGALLIIDHIDHLEKKIAQQLMLFLNSLPNQKIIASRENIKLKEIQITYAFPLLTKEDIVEVLEKNKTITIELKNQKSLYLCRTYIELFNYVYEYKNQLALNSTTKGTAVMNRTKTVLMLTGGFINQELFTKMFDLEKNTIVKLKEQGLVIPYEGFYYPHDSIYNEDIVDDISKLQEHACEYWKCEIKHNKSSSKAMQNFILLTSAFSIEFSSKDTPLYKMIINVMQGRQNTYFMMLLFSYLKNKKIPLDLRIFLCNFLIDIGKFNEANELIVTHHFNDPNLMAIKAELDWWLGDFIECVQKSSTFLSKNISANVKLHFLCSRGIGYFFLGMWEQASIDLKEVIKNKRLSDDKSVYLSYCVLATIQGLRGTDFSASVDNFIHALRCAKRTGKLSWLALIYGNIGEILWKSGFYTLSIDILNTADHLAYLTDNEPLRSEIKRNLLHAYYRNHTELKEIKDLLNELEETFSNESDNYVKMQIVNSLLSHYIFLGEKRYHKLLLASEKLTHRNNEYKIYTLSNLSIASLIEKNKKSAIFQMNKALTLCRSGENWLAMKQCLDDWDETINSHHLGYAHSKQAFQKWHQMLEKKLLPYLHHLSRLCEYLELP